MNKRKIGDILEKKVLSILGPSFYSTAGSGSVFKDGDLTNSDYVVEIKVRSTSGGSISGKDLLKLQTQAIKECKEWLFICENYKQDKIVMLDINQFVVLNEAEKIANLLLHNDHKLYHQIRESLNI